MITFDGLKSAADILRAADKIPEYFQILDAVGKLTELQAQLEAEKQRVRDLQAELDAIRRDQVKSEGMVRQGDFYLLNHHAYCVFCWEVEKRLGPLVPHSKITSGHSYRFYQCTRCKQELTPRMAL
jgi:ABC-type Fe3+-citrate transport system substrate-binding protein